MNILVISDSHKDYESVRKLLDMYKSQVRIVAHLGDHARDLLRFAPEYPMLETRAVAGNCDYDMSIPPEHVLTVQGRHILLLHGHSHHVKQGTDWLAYYAEDKGVDVCLFGHTHRPVTFDRGPVFFLNPGSIAAPQAGEKCSYGLLSISDNGAIKGKVLNI